MKLMHFIFTLQLGGIEDLIRSLSLTLRQSGHQSTLIAFAQDSSAGVAEKYIDVFKNSGIGYHCLDKPKGKQRIRTILRLRKLIRQEKPDILIVHLERLTPLVIPAAFALKIPIVQVIHNEYTRGNLFHRLIGKRFVKRYVAVSQNALTCVMRRFALRREQALLIRNGIDLDTFRSISRDYSRMKRIGHVGRMTPQKNQMELILIYRYLRELCLQSEVAPPELHLVGTGELEADIRAEIRQTQLEQLIYLDGTCPDMRAVYADCDLFVLPSRWEGLPLVLLEAAASGLPCVCYNVGGVGEVITDGVDGVLVEPGNPGQLAKALFALICDAAARQALGQAARTAAQRYDIGFCAQQYEALFRTLVR